MKLDEKALEAAVLAHDKEEAALAAHPWGDDRPEQEFSDRISAMDLAIRAYLSALPSSPVSELVERLVNERPVSMLGVLSIHLEAATALTTISTRNAELEREVKRLRNIVHECANSLGNGAYIDPNCSLEFMEVLPVEIRSVVSRSALSTSPQGGEHE